MKHQELTQQVIGVFYEVYNELGHGFLESVNENAMVIALRARGLTVEQHFPFRFGFVESRLARSAPTSLSKAKSS